MAASVTVGDKTYDLSELEKLLGQEKSDSPAPKAKIAKPVKKTFTEKGKDATGMLADYHREKMSKKNDGVEEGDIISDTLIDLATGGVGLGLGKGISKLFGKKALETGAKKAATDIPPVSRAIAKDLMGGKISPEKVSKMGKGVREEVLEKINPSTGEKLKIGLRTAKVPEGKTSFISENGELASTMGKSKLGKILKRLNSATKEGFSTVSKDELRKLNLLAE